MNWVILGDMLHMGYRPSAKVTLWRDPKGFYSMEVTRRLGHKKKYSNMSAVRRRWEARAVAWGAFLHQMEPCFLTPGNRVIAPQSRGCVRGIGMRTSVRTKVRTSVRTKVRTSVFMTWAEKEERPA